MNKYTESAILRTNDDSEDSIKKILSLFIKLYRINFSQVIRLSYYDYLTKHPYPFWSQLWNFIPLALFYSSTYFFFNRINFHQSNDHHLTLGIGLCCWNFFRESTSQASSIYNQKWKLIKNVSISKIKLHSALTLSSFMSFIINLIIGGFLLFILLPVSERTIQLRPTILIGLGELFLLTLGTNMIVATVCAIFRDGHQIWGIFVQVFFWINPIMWNNFETSPSIIVQIMAYNPFSLVLNHLYASLTRSHMNFNYGFTVLSVLGIFILGTAVSKKGEKNVILRI